VLVLLVVFGVLGSGLDIAGKPTMQQQRQRFGHGKGSYRGYIAMRRPGRYNVGWGDDAVQRRNLPRRGKMRLIGAGGEPHTEGRRRQDFKSRKKLQLLRMRRVDLGQERRDT